jgi:hypothetical protein
MKSRSFGEARAEAMSADDVSRSARGLSFMGSQSLVGMWRSALLRQEGGSGEAEGAPARLCGEHGCAAQDPSLKGSAGEKTQMRSAEARQVERTG